jgi:hypothetical protein
VDIFFAKQACQRSKTKMPRIWGGGIDLIRGGKGASIEHFIRFLSLLSKIHEFENHVTNYQI